MIFLEALHFLGCCIYTFLVSPALLASLLQLLVHLFLFCTPLNIKNQRSLKLPSRPLVLPYTFSLLCYQNQLLYMYITFRSLNLSCSPISRLMKIQVTISHLPLGISMQLKLQSAQTKLKDGYFLVFFA